MRRGRIAVLASAALVLVCAVTTGVSSAASGKHARYRIVSLCGVPHPGSAACMAEKLVPSSLSSSQLKASAKRQRHALRSGVRTAVTNSEPEPGYLTPQSLHAAYSLPSESSGSGAQTIALVDAFDDPTAEADLKVYDEQFGLPPCTTANGCFRKLDEQGKASPLPAVQGEWAGEISIDVQMARAICENCHILLIEAESEEFSDLGTAVDTAVSAGATVVSNSYGGTEESSYSSYQSHYHHPGVVIAASSGDCGYFNKKCRQDPVGANFPADSPDVVAVGGTSLTKSAGTWTSTTWVDGGSGCSSLFAAPSWQISLAGFSATGCGGGRSIADTSAIGDPETGVDVYDSTPEGNGDPTGWGVWGGTSVAAPIVAGEFALGGGAHGVEFPAATLYQHNGQSNAFYDVISGNNGSCSGTTACQAVSGFDGPTGLGSPVGLRAFSAQNTPSATAPPGISGTAEQGLALTETHGQWTSSPTSYAYQWLRCNSAGATCSPIPSATEQSYTLVAADVGFTIRAQETASNAEGAGSPSLSTQSAVVVSDIPTISGFAPAGAPTGSVVTITGTAFEGTETLSFGKFTASFKVISPTQIEATVPNGASAGKVSLTTHYGSATSKAKFTPTLSLISFSPASAAAGKTISIKGLGFNSSSRVSFAGTPAASVTFVSSKHLKVVVPPAAGNGPITVTNSASPVGSVESPSSFSLG